MSKLTFEEFSKANEARKKQFFKNASEMWTLADALVACMGELGEVANALKKVRRAELGMLNKNDPGRQINSLEEAKAQVAGEIGGFMCYLDQLCVQLGLRLEDCIVDEFNKKSEELGLPERVIGGCFVLLSDEGAFVSPEPERIIGKHPGLGMPYMRPWSSISSYRAAAHAIGISKDQLAERIDGKVRSSHTATVGRLELTMLDGSTNIYNFDEPVEMKAGLEYEIGVNANDQPFIREMKPDRPTVWTDGCGQCRYCAMDMDMDPFCTHPTVKSRAGATVGIGLNAALQTCTFNGKLSLFEPRS